MSGRAFAALAVLVGLGGAASAHWVTPEAIVAELNSPHAREALGVENAVRDEKAPRLLVIRVGEGWYRLPAATRRTQAGDWLSTWRESVAEGVVSILDARTQRAVVHFGPGGRVEGVAAGPR
jgi:hypothetical protein